jgi:protocatechuate 3,4-dioxygenase, beta subunit
MLTSKRGFLIAAGAAGLLVPAGRTLGADNLIETPDMALGPFYPVRKPSESDADLTRIKGHAARAKGEVIEVSGRVLTPDGKPQPGARIEIWQANSFGRYDHPGDHSAAAPDPDFQGSAQLVADAAGAFRFLTIRPPPYKASAFMRAPHIHFDVAGVQQRLITQMYFKVEEALMRQDKVLMTDMGRYDSPFPDHIFGQPAKAPAVLQPGAPHYSFDVVLSGG